MKKIILSFLLAFTLTLPLSVSAIAMDQKTTTTSTETQTTSSTENTEKTEKSYEIEDKTSADFNKNLQARIKTRKESLKTTVTTATQAKIKAKCQAGQGLINKLSEKASATKTSRDDIYNNMTKNATKLSDRLKENGQDTTTLDANIKELNTLITKFKSDLKDMRQAAQDAATMDCKTDPAGFYTSLTTLRASRELVAQDSAAIRVYIKDTLKPTLQEIRKNIGQTNKTTEGTN